LGLFSFVVAEDFATFLLSSHYSVTVTNSETGSSLQYFKNILLFPLQLSKPPVGTQVSYVNSLEHLLKEKEQSKRFAVLKTALKN